MNTSMFGYVFNLSCLIRVLSRRIPNYTTVVQTSMTF